MVHIAGRKKTHKGGHRHFTSEDDLAREQEKARKEREWRVCDSYGHYSLTHWLENKYKYTTEQELWM